MQFPVSNYSKRETNKQTNLFEIRTLYSLTEALNQSLESPSFPPWPSQSSCSIHNNRTISQGIISLSQPRLLMRH